MFDLKQDYINEEVRLGGQSINKSGCYVAEIKGASIWTSSFSDSEALNLEIETEDKRTARLSIFYKNKNGETISFNEAHISQLAYLLGVNKPRVDTKNNIPSFIGGKIGIFIKVGSRYNEQKGREYYDYNLVGFYDPNTLQTSQEKANNLQAKKYEYLKNTFEQMPEVILNTSSAETQTNNSSNDNGFFPIDDNDIPF